MKLKRLIVTACFSISCCTASNCSILNPLLTKPVPAKYTDAEIYEIARQAYNAETAFKLIDKKITFMDGHDDKKFGDDRWMSLQELLSLGTGDCDDGMMGFKALLADDPEYTVKAVWLTHDEREYGHAIAPYKYKGYWGYASFNHTNFKGKKFNVFRDALKAKYTSLEDAIKGYMKNDGEEWHEYAVIEFSKEELLCGEIVFGANMKKGKKLEWKKLK